MQYSSTDSCTDNFIPAIGSSSNCSRKGPEFCPRIAAGQQKIFVPVGEPVSVSIALENINSFLLKQHFQCLESNGLVNNLSNSLTTKNNKVLCGEMIYKWKEDELEEPTKTFNMSIAWGENNVITQSIVITLYRCHLLATNCVNCQLLPQQFPCFWSVASSSCLDNSVCLDSDCLSRNATCPGATIKEFYPSSGLLEGGYNVTITGGK